MMGWLLLAVAAGCLALHLTSIALYLIRARWSRRAAGTLGLPPVALLRPVCGRDPFDVVTLASSFAQDYPNYEIIFCAPSERDPAVPLVESLIAAYPGVRARLLIGDSTITGNPKLNNLWKGWRATGCEWVCMTDGNLLLPPDYLRTVVGSWRAGTGLVSSPAIGIEPDGMAGSLECAFLNSNQARLQFASDHLGHGFAQGKTLFWNRTMLDRAGGIPALGRYLAEDVNATKLVRAAGLNVRLTPLPFAQPIGRRSFREVWARQLRWSRVRRDGFPLIFATEVANGALAPALALTGAGLAFGLAPAAVILSVLLLLVVWYGAESYLVRRVGWPAGPLDLAALPLRDLLIPVLWAATVLDRNIEWRGTAMAPVDAEAAAGAADPAADPQEGFAS